MRSAAIVTVGSELTLGLRVDTNTAEIARSLTPCGFFVHEAVSIADECEVLGECLRRLCAAYELVIVTGGLGPTHDDITREAASEALGLPLERDSELEQLLRPRAASHADPEAVERMLVQADVLLGADVLRPTTGTAPGQVVRTAAGSLALLPGPPSEMRPMLASLLERYETPFAQPVELGVAQTSESDAQLMVDRALDSQPGIGFTILARPGDVRVLLSDAGAGEATLAAAVSRVAAALGDRCYSTNGESPEQVVVRVATEHGLTLGTAESCTGGMVSAALTAVPGSSAAFLGGVVSYDNEVKAGVLGVPHGMIAQYGAVSEEVAVAMAEGALERLGCDLAVSVTGIAGPSGGSAEKPVGTVWFGVAGVDQPSFAFVRRFAGGSRASVRDRATGTVLDVFRRTMLGMPPF